MIVIDTSMVYALLDAGDWAHAEAAAWYRSTDEELVTTPLVLGEVDHLLARVGSRVGRAAFREDVRAGGYRVEWWTEAVGDSLAVSERYESLGVDLTDASVVVLASRLETTKIATRDERLFRALQPLSGGPAFVVLPADA